MKKSFGRILEQNNYHDVRSSHLYSPVVGIATASIASHEHAFEHIATILPKV